MGHPYGNVEYALEVCIFSYAKCHRSFHSDKHIDFESFHTHTFICIFSIYKSRWYIQISSQGFVLEGI